MEYYKKIAKLGMGTYGSAYLVLGNRTKRRYVLKEIHNIKTVNQFKDCMKEARFLRELRSPFVVAHTDTFYAFQKLCIVMEYCDFGDLSGVIRHFQRTTVYEPKVSFYLAQICLGLRYIHSRDVIHRDLKPQNVFLRADGMVKIGDFGLARKLNYANAFATTLAGTMFYMSPEMLSCRPYNCATDIWSLGAMLYEMVILEKPFGNAYDLLKGRYPILDRNIRRELRYIIFWTLQVNPARRLSITSLINSTHLFGIVQRCFPKHC